MKPLRFLAKCEQIKRSFQISGIIILHWYLAICQNHFWFMNQYIKNHYSNIILYFINIIQLLASFTFCKQARLDSRIYSKINLLINHNKTSSLYLRSFSFKSYKIRISYPPFHKFRVHPAWRPNSSSKPAPPN
jgi:hypothetical protein